ncbi:DUF397 domain-containing protein [Streptomyces montanisoli]|uniref:DUF397 domain-containing protein n=1 Tax=Streptomyces montanisoli TaxID=2798581 RepID=A0A940MJM8_9ACTN|nr:DUF397 domain-containing protein [Streptomyces montanisoli]MBP0460531.1 DUF397 domain-containing protein [Streptomyces montanisoli]
MPGPVEPWHGGSRLLRRRLRAHRRGSTSRVAELPHGARAVRDSKSTDREPLRFTASEWAAFQAGVIAGEL